MSTSIKADVEWLGFEWDAMFFASDYFEQLYQFAVELIRRDKAYVDSLTADEIRAYRGTLTEPGQGQSVTANRPIEESLDLFARMRSGEFADGAHVLRAKIDMASPNMNMRDPTLYRIRRATHHRTGDAWCIYPMYDYAHPLSDALERITHSLCTLEFEDHRPLYDWCVEQLIEGDRPRQIEFARLNLNYTVMSKRKLLQLVQQRHVSGWDDPRMPTISGLRRRGYTPESIRDFCSRIGVAKKENVIDVAQLEHSIRDDLNKRAPRVMVVLRPLKLVITNYPEGQVEEVDVVNNPEDASAGTRKVPFSQSPVHRAGRFPRGSAEEVLQAVAGEGSAAAQRVFRHLHRCRQERPRRSGRSALHLRSADSRRRFARRPAREGHAALGVGRARAAGRSAALRSVVLGARSGARP